METAAEGYSATKGNRLPAHLCLFTDSLDPSGVGEHMLALAAGLTDRYRITFVCPPNSAGRRFLDRAAALGCAQLRLCVRRDARAHTVLRDWCARERVDIFHGHAGIGWEGHAGIIAAREAGVPVVVRTEHLPHLISDQAGRLDHLRMVEALDWLVCVSAGVAESYLARGIPYRLVRVVRNGIRPTAPSRTRADVRASLGIASKTPLLLTVGRLSRQKGYDTLLEAVPAVAARYPDARFVWVGAGPLRRRYERRIASFDLENRVHLLGRRDDVPDLLAAADLFVLPSRFEGLPLSALEAMASGLPIVSTRVCGSREVVDDGVTGLLVPPDDAGALAEALLQALGNRDRLAAWGAAGHCRYEECFRAQRMVDELQALYVYSDRSATTETKWIPTLADQS